MITSQENEDESKEKKCYVKKKSKEEVIRRGNFEIFKSYWVYRKFYPCIKQLPS